MEIFFDFSLLARSFCWLQQGLSSSYPPYPQHQHHSQSSAVAEGLAWNQLLQQADGGAAASQGAAAGRDDPAGGMLSTPFPSTFHSPSFDGGGGGGMAAEPATTPQHHQQYQQQHQSTAMPHPTASFFPSFDARHPALGERGDAGGGGGESTSPSLRDLLLDKWPPSLSEVPAVESST